MLNYIIRQSFIKILTINILKVYNIFMTNKNIYFMAGLQRSGATVLSAILNQNPDIYASPSSTCNHIGNLKYQGNFSEFLKRLEKIIEEQKEKKDYK